MNQLKILILMTYYNRPILVKNALNSILKANEFHQNWHLLFGDDGSYIPGEPIVKQILKDHIDKISFINSNQSIEYKLLNGLNIGKYANEFIKKSDADVALILCDDDEVFPDYFLNLNQFFCFNPDVLYCYSKIRIYNPLIQKSEDVKNDTNKYNKYSEPINPTGKVDASQVAWRLKCCHEYNAWFPQTTYSVENKPWVADTDKSFFEQLFMKCGYCVPTDFFAQYKGVHDYQLLWHKNSGVDLLKKYDTMCRDLAGVKF